MAFTIKIWILKITLNLMDLDPSDRDIKIGITVSW